MKKNHCKSSLFIAFLFTIAIFTISCGGGGSGGGGEYWIPTKLWTRQLGTTSYDGGYGVAVDSSGNCYVTGPTDGDLDGNINAGSADIFLVKYNVNGNKIWTRQLGTTADDCSYGIAVDASRNVYVTGYTEGNLDGNINAGSADIFLVKYDTNGNKIWTRQLGTDQRDIGWGVITDSGGNIYVAGYTEGNLDGNINAGSADIFLVKYDTNGNKLWTRQLGTASYDEGRGVAVDSIGNIYVTGYTGGGLDGNTNLGSADIFLVKYDTNGNKLWTRQLGTDQSDSGYGIALDSGGNIYITGRIYGYGGIQMFLLKCDNSGTKQWEEQNVHYSIGTGVAVNRSDEIYVSGQKASYFYGHFYYMLVYKYNTAGTLIWDGMEGEGVIDKVIGAEGIAVDASGNVYVTGYTDYGLDGNINAGSADIFLVKYKF
jgi:hypothetical protein